MGEWLLDIRTDAKRKRLARIVGRRRECGSHVDHHGDLVLDVEDGAKAFRRACRKWGDTVAVVRRHLELSADGVRRWC